MQPEFEEEENQPDELIDTVEILLPIREQKLIRLKRTLRQEKDRLREMNQDLKQGEQRLSLFREKYKKSLADFSTNHTGVILQHEKLLRTLEAERLSRSRLLKQESDNQSLAERITQQMEVIDKAGEAVLVCQKEIEKLEYILEEKDMI